MLMTPPSSIDATAVGADGARGDGQGAPRVELAYEPRYQRYYKNIVLFWCLTLS